MDFNERLKMYQEGGMINDNDVKDINAIIDMFKREYNVTLQEENADTFIAHLCATYSRNSTHDKIEKLPENIANQLTNLNTYKESIEVLNKIIEVTSNCISDDEKEYILLHLNNLIEKFILSGEWKKEN